MGTDLYTRTMAWAEETLDADGAALQHKVWDDTPWMVNAYTGGIGDDRDYDTREWCREKFGDEAWPIHGKPGVWYRGSVTIHGWTWFGFKTREMMEQFEAAWPAPVAA